MKYFLDSSDIREVEYAFETFGIEGVTTNPRQLAVIGKKQAQVVDELAAWAANKGFTRLMDRLPKFKGKSAVTAIGSFVAGIPASMAASSFAAKHMPIARLTSPTMEQYGAQLMQKTSARIASKYTYRRY